MSLFLVISIHSAKGDISITFAIPICISFKMFESRLKFVRIFIGEREFCHTEDIKNGSGPCLHGT